MLDRYDALDWRPVPASRREHGRHPATYVVSIERPIDRLLGQDPRGILCIGEAGNLQQRLGQFRSGLANGWGHSEANRFHRLRLASRLGVGSGPLVRYVAMPSKVEARGLQDMLLLEYEEAFGELPPLNSMGGMRGM